MRAAHVVAAAAALALLPCATRAQVPGPLLRNGALEIGVSVHDYDRSLAYRDQPSTFEGIQYAAAFRLGVTETFTASVELSAGTDVYEDDGSAYLVGAAMQTRLWDHGSTRITTSMAYARGMVVFRSSDYCDEMRQHLDWNAQVEHSFDVREQDVTLWGGPALSFMNLQRQAPCYELTAESTQIIGGLLGAGVVMEKHVVIGLQWLWIDSMEYAFQLAYRF